MLNDGTTTATYNEFGQLTGRTVNATSVATTYASDADGVLVGQTTGGTTTRYVQDRSAGLPQVLAAGSTNYVYGAERLYGLSAGVRTWELHDALGSVRRTTSGTTVSAPISDDASGQVRGGATLPRFGYTGELQDAATGQVYLRARWYNAASGRFGSRDDYAGEIEQPQSLHRFAYVHNDPVNATDPTGRSPQEWMIKAFFEYSPTVLKHGAIYFELALNLASRTGFNRAIYPRAGRIDIADITMMMGYIYEVEPSKYQSLAEAEILHYSTIYRTLPRSGKWVRKDVFEPYSLQLGNGFPAEWQIIGTDPTNTKKAIIAKQGVPGVIIRDRIDKVNLPGYPVYVYEYDPQTRRAKQTKPTPPLWPFPPFPAPPVPCPVG